MVSCVKNLLLIKPKNLWKPCLDEKQFYFKQKEIGQISEEFHVEPSNVLVHRLALVFFPSH
jgi:hypothetical protein